MDIPRPTDVSALSELSGPLDAATHADRVAWCRSLGAKQLYALYELAKGSAVSVDDLVRDNGEVVIHWGKNGVPVFNRFQKRFARQGDVIVGYNDNSELAGFLSPVAGMVTGPGHYTAYDSPEVPGEVWVDYRRVPTQQHPEFPPLIDNTGGLRSLVFGNMVDIIRRVSEHVFIGDATKAFEPVDGKLTLGCKIGRILPTAPFAMCQE